MMTLQSAWTAREEQLSAAGTSVDMLEAIRLGFYLGASTLLRDIIEPAGNHKHPDVLQHALDTINHELDLEVNRLRAKG